MYIIRGLRATLSFPILAMSPAHLSLLNFSIPFISGSAYRECSCKKHVERIIEPKVIAKCTKKNSAGYVTKVINSIDDGYPYQPLRVYISIDG